MQEIETDYLVVGAGASAMAFVDSLIDASDADVVMVDRRHRPGGHWLDAYPFVRLHQPSANYGVNSRPLGGDRIDESGPNAGFYERATASEICDYFGRVLDEQFLPSGRVRFLGMHDYRADRAASGDGHVVVSLLTGEETVVRVRRKVVDATYTESSIPSRHTPAFAVDEGVRLIPPNDLVDLHPPAAGFTVIGAGKTAMDTCNWLLDTGVSPSAIRWVRPRDPWLFNRTYMQPLSLVGSYMHLQARWVEAAAEAEDATDFAHRLEAAGILVRIDPDVEPEAFRGAIVSLHELEGLRSIDHVIRGRVLRISADAITTTQGTVASDPDQVYVDCTAAGVRATEPRPVFEGDRITLQYVTIGNTPWGASTIGAVEARRDDDAEKNRLCPPVVFTGNAADLLQIAYSGMSGLAARGADPELAAWDARCRLSMSRGAMERLGEPDIAASFGVIAGSFGAAMENLVRRTGAAPAAV